jgi:integrase
MPERGSTKRGYLIWVNNYILPRWGQIPLPEIKARAVELWLSGLNLAPKSRSNIRMMLSVIFEYAMWAELIPVDRNPMELVRVKNVSKPGRKARTMRLEEFHRLCEMLTEPYRTMAIVSVCLGLRWSELVGLQWQDIDWLGGELDSASCRGQANHGRSKDSPLGETAVPRHSAARSAESA